LALLFIVTLPNCTSILIPPTNSYLYNLLDSEELASQKTRALEESQLRNEQVDQLTRTVVERTGLPKYTFDLSLLNSLAYTKMMMMMMMTMMMTSSDVQSHVTLKYIKKHCIVY
jgi:hypothetical protein